MGAYSPTPVVTDDMAGQVMAEIILPTVAAMTPRGTPYRGVLYVGVMVTADGQNWSNSTSASATRCRC